MSSTIAERRARLAAEREAHLAAEQKRAEEEAQELAELEAEERAETKQKEKEEAEKREWEEAAWKAAEYAESQEQWQEQLQAMRAGTEAHKKMDWFGPQPKSLWKEREACWSCQKKKMDCLAGK